MSDTTGYHATLPPNGVYRAQVTTADLLAHGADQKFAAENHPLLTLTFRDGLFTVQFDQKEPCLGDMRSVDGQYLELVERSPQLCGFGGGRDLWREEPTGISLLILPPTDSSLSLQDWADLQGFFERTWTRIGDAPVLASPSS